MLPTRMVADRPSGRSLSLSFGCAWACGDPRVGSFDRVVRVRRVALLCWALPWRVYVCVMGVCLCRCVIDWKKGKNVTVKTIKKKQKHKGRGTVRTITKQVPNDSFFNFFSPLKGEWWRWECHLRPRVTYPQGPVRRPPENDTRETISRECARAHALGSAGARWHVGCSPSAAGRRALGSLPSPLGPSLPGSVLEPPGCQCLLLWG